MKKLLLLPFLLLTACAQDFEVGYTYEPQGIMYSQEFEPYMQRFLDLARHYQVPMKNRTYSIEFVDSLQGSTVGTCQRNSRHAHIKVLKSFWFGNDTVSWTATRESLFFHELGHCLYDKDHNPNKINGTSSSLMNPNVVYGGTYQDYYDTYLREFFLNVAPQNMVAGALTFDASYYTNSSSNLVSKPTSDEEDHDAGCDHETNKDISLEDLLDIDQDMYAQE